MKRLTTILIACLFTVFTMAQTAETTQTPPLVNKKGIPIMPVAGDWSVGIDATPFIMYMGNIFSSNNNNVPSFGFTAQQPGAIYGKRVISSFTTIRASLTIGLTNDVIKSENANNVDEIDRDVTTAAALGASIGIEKTTHNYGRLRGLYGAQVGGLKTPHVDGRLSYIDGDNSDNDFIVRGGNTLSFVIGGFMGVEYFILPKISLSGEFQLNFLASLTTKRTLMPQVGDDVTLDYGSSSISFAPAATGNLILNFYF